MIGFLIISLISISCFWFFWSSVCPIRYHVWRIKEVKEEEKTKFFIESAPALFGIPVSYYSICKLKAYYELDTARASLEEIKKKISLSKYGPEIKYHK